MKRILLLLLLAACCLLLTACYTDHDPWRETIFTSTAAPAPAVTVVPATDVPPTAVPATPQPVFTQEPLPEAAVDVSPNFNG